MRKQTGEMNGDSWHVSAKGVWVSFALFLQTFCTFEIMSKYTRKPTKKTLALYRNNRRKKPNRAPWAQD